MVSSFQDGDSNVGFGKGYGPSHHLGDLQGVINSLDYIKDLGFNAIWMTPIFVSGGDDKLVSTGYYPVDYFNIDTRFGGNEKFKELVSSAHAKGIYVILDGVFGHHENPVVQPSPNGNYLVSKTSGDDYGRKVLYPDSKAFFQEVAQYWIDKYEIDGWRLDVAKELTTKDQNGNYLYDIRQAVESICDQRKAAGKEWGILGYIVGEFWDSIDEINTHVYVEDADEPALRSAFDFPFRSSLVQLLAQDEYGAKKESNVLREIMDLHRFPFEKTYSRNDVYPNFFLSNHDLYRFGNLIRLRYEIDVDNDKYWKLHKIAIAILSVYSGPITLYYGDEIGDITDCWNGNEGTDCPETSNYRVEKSNSARTNGKISNFNERQTDLHDYTKALLNARLNHPSMWRGTYGKTTQGNVYFDCKYDPVTGDKTVFVLNMGDSTTVNYEVGGIKLYDFVKNEVIYNYESGKYKIQLGALEARVFQVYDEDVVIETPTPIVQDCAAAQEAYASSQKAENNRKLVFVIVGAAVVVVVVIVIAIVIIVRMKRKYEKELDETKSNPLVDMSLE